MSKLIILRGLPASGKSTYAAQLVMQQHFKRINADDLRRMVDNNIYSKDNDSYITSIMQFMTKKALQDGHNVVLDNTNLNTYHINWALDIAAEAKSEALVLTMNVDVNECIRRDLERSNGRVGKEVIMKLYNKYYINGVLDAYRDRPVKTLDYNY